MSQITWIKIESPFDAPNSYSIDGCDYDHEAYILRGEDGDFLDCMIYHNEFEPEGSECYWGIYVPNDGNCLGDLSEAKRWVQEWFKLDNITEPYPESEDTIKFGMFSDLASSGVWKYGMVLVEVNEYGEEICELAELYPNKAGEYTSWCKAHITSPVDLERAMKDVERDGINRWFYENGKFSIIKDEWAVDYLWQSNPV